MKFLRISFLGLGVACFAMSGCERHKFDDVKGLYEGHGAHEEHGDQHHKAEGDHPAQGDAAHAEKHDDKHAEEHPAKAEKAPAGNPKDVGL